MNDLRHRGKTRFQRTDFARQFCGFAGIPKMLMGFFDSRKGIITDSWIGQTGKEVDLPGQDMLRLAQSRLAQWAKVQDLARASAEPAAPAWMRAEGLLIGVGSEIGGVYPLVVVPETSLGSKPRHKTMIQMALSYVTHQLSEEFYARCGWMETLVDTAMQVLSIQFLVVRPDGKITFDSLKDLPHQFDQVDSIARSRKTFLESATNSSELQAAVLAATTDQRRTSIVSVFNSTGVPQLVVVTPLANSDTPAALVLFESEDTDHAKLRQHFFNAYRLTRSESLIAHEILSGRSIAEAAEARRLSQATVRSYMKQVFSKTGTHKQSELVSLYFNSILPVTSNLRVSAE